MNLKFAVLLLVIAIFIIGGIYFGFLEIGDKNLFSQISGVSSDDFQYVGEVELINDSVNQNNNQKVTSKLAKRNKKITNLNENVVKVVSGVAAIIATSTAVSSTPIIENNVVQASSTLAQEQNQEQIIISPIVPVPVVPDIPVAPVIQLNAINHILISEIMVGMEGNIDYEFIELYNPTSQSIDLTGWSIKKKSSTGSTSTLVSNNTKAGSFKDKKIMPNKYLLLANKDGYNSSIQPDILYSETLAYKNNAIIVYSANNELVEEISWTEIQKGQSIERVSWDSNEFRIQSNPNPQNSQSN